MLYSKLNNLLLFMSVCEFDFQNINEIYLYLDSYTRTPLYRKYCDFVTLPFSSRLKPPLSHYFLAMMTAEEC